MTSFIDGLRMMTRWNKLWVESMFFVSSFSFHFVKQVFALLLYFSTFEQKKSFIILFADGTSSQQVKETAIACSPFV